MKIVLLILSLIFFIIGFAYSQKAYEKVYFTGTINNYLLIKFILADGYPVANSITITELKTKKRFKFLRSLVDEKVEGEELYFEPHHDKKKYIVLKLNSNNGEEIPVQISGDYHHHRTVETFELHRH